MWRWVRWCWGWNHSSDDKNLVESRNVLTLTGIICNRQVCLDLCGESRPSRCRYARCLGKSNGSQID